MKPSTRVTTAIAALVLIAGAAFLLGMRHGETAPIDAAPPAAAVDAEAAATVADTVGEGDAAGVAAAPAAAAPPPGGADVATVIAQLQPRADAGDSQAACRVALELLACRDAAAQVAAMATSDRGGAQLGGSGSDVASEEVLRIVEDINLRILARHEACNALPAELRDRSGSYLAAAARAGNVEAMLRYADGTHLRGDTDHDMIAHPDFDAWRREAPAMLQRMLQGGAPEAVYLLFEGSSGRPGPLPGLIADDPLLAQAYAYLLVRIGANAPPASADLDAADRHRAEQLADQWYREYFHSRRFDDGAAMQRLVWSPAMEGAYTRTPCIH